MAIGRPQHWHKCTVANLPATAAAGRRERAYIVTDGASYGDVTTGGGSFVYPVWHDGTNWQTLGIATVDSSGNVGIGTATPGYELEVNGIIAGNKISCTAVVNSNLSVADATVTVVPFAGTDAWDYGGLHDPSSNNSRFTVPYDGLYSISASVWWDGNATGRRILGYAVNGTSANWLNSFFPNSTQTAYLGGSTVVDLAANDYIEFEVYQQSGVALNVKTPNSWGNVTLIHAY